MQELKGEAVRVSRTLGGLRQRHPARLTSYLWQWEGLPGLLRPNGMEDTGSTGPLSIPPMPVTDLLIRTDVSWGGSNTCTHTDCLLPLPSPVQQSHTVDTSEMSVNYCDLKKKIVYSAR